MEHNARLNVIYYDPADAASYLGARRILNKTKNVVDKSAVYKWLSAQDACTLHKRVVRNFPRLHYNVRAMDVV